MGMRIPGCNQMTILSVVAALAATGCEHPLVEDTIFDKAYIERHLPSEENVLKASTFQPRPVGVVQTYCYSTIGEVECYAHPQKEERYRLNGYFGPAPD